MGIESCFCRSSAVWESFPQEVRLDHDETWIEMLKIREERFGRHVKVWPMSMACSQEHENLGFWEGPTWEKIGGVKVGDAEDPRCHGMDTV